MFVLGGGEGERHILNREYDDIICWWLTKEEMIMFVE